MLGRRRGRRPSINPALARLLAQFWVDQLAGGDGLSKDGATQLFLNSDCEKQISIYTALSLL